MFIDFWNNGTLKDVYKISVFFSDLDSIYYGNMYNNKGVIIGDFIAKDSLIITETFPFYKWD